MFHVKRFYFFYQIRSENFFNFIPKTDERNEIYEKRFSCLSCFSHFSELY